MDSLKKCNDGIEKGIVAMGSIMFMIMLVACSWQVFSRYVLNNAAMWTEESARFSMCYTSMLGSAILLRHKGHVAMTLLSNKITDIKKSFVLDLVNVIIILIFLFFMTYYGWISTVSATKQVSTALGLNYGFVYACVPISGILMVWFSIEHIVILINNYRKGTVIKKREERD